MLFLATLAFGAVLSVAEPPQTQNPASSSDHVIAKYLGEVREYKPGNLLEIDIGDKRVKSYDLTDKNKSFDVGAGIGKGTSVNIVEYRNAAGREVVSVTARH